MKLDGKLVLPTGQQLHETDPCLLMLYSSDIYVFTGSLSCTVWHFLLVFLAFSAAAGCMKV